MWHDEAGNRLAPVFLQALCKYEWVPAAEASPAGGSGLTELFCWRIRTQVEQNSDFSNMYLWTVFSFTFSGQLISGPPREKKGPKDMAQAVFDAAKQWERCVYVCVYVCSTGMMHCAIGLCNCFILCNLLLNNTLSKAFTMVRYVPLIIELACWHQPGLLLGCTTRKCILWCTDIMQSTVHSLAVFWRWYMHILCCAYSGTLQGLVFSLIPPLNAAYSERLFLSAVSCITRAADTEQRA